MEKFEADYGYDAQLHTYTEAGEYENGTVYIQLKATDNLESYRLKSGTLSFPLDRRDLELWLNQILPVILVLFEAQQERAYWLYLQQYFAQQQKSLDSFQTDTVSVHLQKPVNLEAIKQWRDSKNAVLLQITQRGIKYHV